MPADRLLTAVFNTGVAVLVVATVLSLGMSFTVGQVLAPLRRVVLMIVMIVMIVVNCGLIPAAAWGLFTVFGIRASVSGATLAAVGAAGAMGLKAAQMSRRAPTGRHDRTAGIHRCDSHRLRPALAIGDGASCPICAHPACRRAGPRGSPADHFRAETPALEGP
jgi:hypothetical protein